MSESTVGRQMFELWLLATPKDLEEFDQLIEVAKVVRNADSAGSRPALQAEPAKKRGRPRKQADSSPVPVSTSESASELPPPAA